MPLNLMIGVCEMAGCFRTTYDSRLCSKCLEGKTPLTRGPVTWAEMARARGLRSQDWVVTYQRNLLHGEDPTLLFRESPE